MRIDGRQLDRAQRSAMDALADPAGSNVYLWGPPGRGKSWLVDAHLASMSRKRVLRSHFHEFFADVLVMDEDEAVRANRLRLLNRFVGVFTDVADFGKMAKGGK